METLRVREAASAHSDSAAAHGGSAGAQRSRLVTPRAILIGVALVPVNAYWMMVAELRWYLILSLNPLFVTPVFVLFWLALVNLLMRRLAPRFVLTAAEMTTIYVMLVLSCTIATHDYIINLISAIGWPAWFSDSVNKWKEVLFPNLPRHLLVWDRHALEGYFAGDETLYTPERILAWLSPLTWWAAFIVVSFFVMFCFNVLLRRAWLEHVRLPFPIVQLPLAMTAPEAPSRFFKSPMVWAGFAVAAGLDLLNGFHQLYPALPFLQTRARYLQITEPPFHVLNYQTLSFYPFAVGLGFLVPLDVSFSCWFFYVFARAQLVLGHMTGLLGLRGFPFQNEQGIGAWVVYGVLLLYATRHHLAQVLATAFPRSRAKPCPPADGQEPLAYPWALLGAAGGLAFLLWFWMKAGMGFVPAVASVASYYLLSLCITRSRAETGGQHTVWDLEPKNLFGLFDSNRIGKRNLAAAAVSHWFWRLNRSHQMPAQLEAFKMAQVADIPPKQLALPMLLAVLVGIPSAMWACLHLLYRDGALAECVGFAKWCGIESFDWLDSALKSGFHLEPARWYAVGGAATFTAFLSLMKMRFTWFPFHPLGYCIGPGLIWTCFPFLLAWASKSLILRYGGHDGYRRATPFFLGLILGDYFMGAFWSLFGWARGVLAYQIFH